MALAEGELATMQAAGERAFTNHLGTHHAQLSTVLQITRARLQLELHPQLEVVRAGNLDSDSSQSPYRRPLRRSAHHTHSHPQATATVALDPA